MQMLTSPSPSPSSSPSSSDSTADVSTTAEDASEDEERGLERERVRVHEGILLERDGDEEACRISSRASPSIIESKGPSVSSSASLGTSTGAAGTLTGEGGSIPSSSPSPSPSPSPKPKPKVEPGKMDPLLSLYYTAPICALMNGVLAWRAEVVPFLQGQGQNQEQGQGQGQGQSQAQGQDESCAGLLGIVLQTGLGLLLLNACVGFMLNVAVFTLVRIIPLLVFFSTYRLRHTK